MARFFVCLLVALVCITGCRTRGSMRNGRDDGGLSDDAQVDGEDAEVDEEEHPSSPDAPRFLSFATNRTQVQVGGSVTFTAVLTDPDGIDDLIGGSLIDVVSGNEYGAFQTSSSEGSYQLTLSWNDIEAVGVPHSNESNATSRTFTARFFDAAGNSNTRSVALALGCFDDPDGEVLCGGACVNAHRDSTCGACDNACSGSNIACVDRRCISATPALIDVETSFDAAAPRPIRFDFELLCPTGDCRVSLNGESEGRATDGGTRYSNGFRAADLSEFRSVTTSGGCAPTSLEIHLALSIEWLRPAAGGGGYGGTTRLDGGVTFTCPSGMMLHSRDGCVAQPGACGSTPTRDAGVADSGRDASVADSGRDSGSGGGGCDGPETAHSSSLGSSVFSGSTAGLAHVDRIACSASGPDMMMRWTAPYDGTFEFNTLGSSFDTYLAAYYRNDCSFGAPIRCDDDGASGGLSRFDLYLAAGESILLFIDGYGGASGAFVINVTER